MHDLEQLPEPDRIGLILPPATPTTVTKVLGHGTQPRPSTEGELGRRAEVTWQRDTEIHALHTTGIGTTAISRALNLDGKTVRRYLRVATADELLTETVPRAKDLDEHATYLAPRWEQGCTNAVRLTTELRERGYRGSARTVRRLLQTSASQRGF